MFWVRRAFLRFSSAEKETRILRKSLFAAATVALVLAVSSPALAQEGGREVPAPEYGPYGYTEPLAPDGPAPDGPVPCQYESGCEDPRQYPNQYVPPSEEPQFAPTLSDEQEAAPNLGDGDAPIEAVGGDPDDAAALSGAIEAARADRAAGVPPAAASEPAISEPTRDGALAVEGVAPADGASGDAEPIAEDEGQVKVDIEEKVSGGGAAPDAVDADEAITVGGARTSGESGGPEIKELPDTSGALPLILLGTGSILLLSAGLLLRRVVR